MDSLLLLDLVTSGGQEDPSFLYTNKKHHGLGDAFYGRESLLLQIKSINFSLLRVIECAIKLLVLSIMMKSKVLFSVIASASLFPFLLSSPSQAWDPEAEIRQQNQQRNQKQRLCDLAKNNPTHKMIRGVKEDMTIFLHMSVAIKWQDIRDCVMRNHSDISIVMATALS